MGGFVTYSVTCVKTSRNQTGHLCTLELWDNVAVMVTAPKKPDRRRLYLKENRKAKNISATEMGRHLGIERESVYRLEREQHRMDPTKQAEYAHHLGLEPEDLWRPPGRPSVDALLRDQPDEIAQRAVEMTQLLLKSRMS